MNTEKKLFAFKLADKQARSADAKWKARDGVAMAACTGPSILGLHIPDAVNHDSMVPC